MVESPGSTERGELYLPTSLALLAFAVGLFVVGMILEVTCGSSTLVTTLSGSTVAVCSYPFQSSGVLLMYGSALITILSFNVLVRYGAAQGSTNDSATSRYILSGLAILGSTVLLLIGLAAVAGH